MNRKPIGPGAHGAIDYGFAALQLLAPSLFGMKGAPRALCYAFGGAQLVLSGLTIYPLGVKPVVPFRVHGELETPVIPALLVLPLLAGALEQPAARRHFLLSFALAAAAYVLTDYRAYDGNPNLPTPPLVRQPDRLREASPS